MEKTPFAFGKIVSTHAFTNREKEAEKLTRNLLGGIHTMLISPRRWGKSSLVEKVILDINKEEKGCKTVILDLFRASNEKAFLEIFAQEVIKASSPKWQEWVAGGSAFFKKLVPRLSFGADPSADFSLSFDWQDLKKNSDEVLHLPETIAQKKKVKFIVCLDEFQNLAAFPEFIAFEKKLRACWQCHKNVSYCLYGSKRHMMVDIFNNPSKPFYRFGDVMLLGKIETQKWVSFICKGFERTGKYIAEDVAVQIPRIMKNHSWYVQQLAHYTWTLTRRKATLAELDAALNELLRTNSPHYQAQAENINQTQLGLLKAVAKGMTQLTGADVMTEYSLGTPRNVSKNKTILFNRDMIDENNGKYEFADPAFEIWFKMQYFNQPYNKLMVNG